MKRFSNKQRLYIMYFLDRAESLLDEMLYPSCAKEMQEKKVSATESAVTTTIAVAGAVAAIPTAGTSLVVAGAALTVAEAIYKVMGSIHGLMLQTYVNIDQAHAGVGIEEQRLRLNLLMSEMAEQVVVRYAYFIDQVIETKSLKTFAQYGVERLLKALKHQLEVDPQFIWTLLDKLASGTYNTDELLETLMESTRLSLIGFSEKIAVKPNAQRLMTSFDTTVPVKWPYSRPCVLTFALPSNSFDTYEFGLYSHSQSSVFLNGDSSHPQYGYVPVLVSSEQAQAPELLFHERRYKRQTHAPDFSKNVKPFLFVPHEVSRDEILEYLAEMHKESAAPGSLNDFLTTRYAVRVIACCHGEQLRGLDLSGGDFSCVNFRHANLSDCNLENSNWDGAQLAFAQFSNCRLSAKSLYNSAGLEQTVWSNVSLAGMFLNANLTGARLNSCEFTAAWKTDGANLAFVEIMDPRVEKLEELRNNFTDHFNGIIRTSVAQLGQEKERLREELHAWEADQEQRWLNQAQFNESVQKDLHVLLDAPALNCLRHVDQHVTALYEATVSEPYIGLNIRSVRNGGGSDISLWKRLEAFMDRDERLFLLHGEIGSGKSLSMTRWQRERYFEYIGKKANWLPIFINLKNVSQTHTQGFLHAALRSVFDEEQIQYVRLHHQCVIILDGLDECCLDFSNFFIIEECVNHANHYWTHPPKIILTSETRFLVEQKQDYHVLLRVSATENEFPLRSEYVLQPFNNAQIDEYLESYYPDKMHLFKNNAGYPELRALAHSPIMLHIICEVLTTLPGHHLPTSRVQFYNEFYRNWFEHIAQKNIAANLTEYTVEVYTMKLAFDMFQQRQEYIEHSSSVEAQDPLQRQLDSQNPSHEFSVLFDNDVGKLAGRMSPTVVERKRVVSKGKDHWIDTIRFRHRSFWFYALAKALVNKLELHQVKNHLHSMRSDGAFAQLLADWSAGYLTDYPGVFDFLKELVRDHESKNIIHEQLCQLVFASKTAEMTGIQAASNAITLLNLTGFNFALHATSDTFRGIKVCKADLRGALLAGVDLSDSDLKGVLFNNAVLIGTRMENADLKGAQFLNVSSFHFARYVPNTFSVYPSDHTVIACDSYDLRSQRYKIVLEDLKESVYMELRGHKKPIHCLAMTSFGEEVFLASAGDSGVVKTWKLGQNRANLHWRYQGARDAAIVSIHWLPHSYSLAVSNRNSTVDIVDTDKKTRRFRYGMEEWGSPLVLWAARSNYFVISTSEGYIQFYKFDRHDDRVGTMTLLNQSFHAKREDEKICSSVLSPNGMHLARGGTEGMITILFNLDLTAGADPVRTKEFRGHFKAITSMVWNLHALITASRDSTIRVWHPRDQRILAVYADNGVETVAGLTGGRRFIGGGPQTRMLSIWNVEQQSTINQDDWLDFLGVTGVIAGGYLALDHLDCSVFLWHLDQLSEQRWDKAYDHNGISVKRLVASQGGRFLASLSSLNEIIIYDVDRQEIWRIPPKRWIDFHDLTFYDDPSGELGLMVAGLFDASHHMNRPDQHTDSRLYRWHFISNELSPRGDWVEQVECRLRPGSARVFCLETAPSTFTANLPATSSLDNVRVLVQSADVVNAVRAPISRDRHRVVGKETAIKSYSIGACEEKISEDTSVFDKPKVWVALAAQTGIAVWNSREPTNVPITKFFYTIPIKKLHWSLDGQFLAFINVNQQLSIVDTWTTSATWPVVFRHDQGSVKSMVWAQLHKEGRVISYFITAGENGMNVYEFEPVARVSMGVKSPIKWPYTGDHLVYNEPRLYVFHKKSIQVFNFDTFKWEARLGEASMCVAGLVLTGAQNISNETRQLLEDNAATVDPVPPVQPDRWSSLGLFSSSRALLNNFTSLPPITLDDTIGHEESENDEELASSSTLTFNVALKGSSI